MRAPYEQACFDSFPAQGGCGPLGACIHQPLKDPQP